MYSNTLNFLSFKGNIIGTWGFRPVMSPPVEFISFAEKSNHRFLLIFFSVAEEDVLTEIITRMRSNPRYKLGRISFFFFFFVMVVANCNANRDWLHIHCSQW